MDPALITAGVGMEPRNQWKAPGRANRPGTYWCSEQRRGEDSEIADVLENLLDQLESNKTFLDQFTSTGGEISFFVGWFTSERSGGSTLCPTLLGRMAALKISLELDIFGSAAGKSPC
jgi:hypothetical protein